MPAAAAAAAAAEPEPAPPEASKSPDAPDESKSVYMRERAAHHWSMDAADPVRPQRAQLSERYTVSQWQ